MDEVCVILVDGRLVGTRDQLAQMIGEFPVERRTVRVSEAVSGAVGRRRNRHGSGAVGRGTTGRPLADIDEPEVGVSDNTWSIGHA